MRFYLDTSALIQLYFPEKHSAAVSRYVAGQAIPYSFFHDLEARGALLQKVFRMEASRSMADETIRTIEGDLASGSLYRPPADWANILRRSIAITTQHTPKLGCRALDVLHVAHALELSAGAFVSFDDRQNALASATGLRVVDLSRT